MNLLGQGISPAVSLAVPRLHDGPMRTRRPQIIQAQVLRRASACTARLLLANLMEGTTALTSCHNLAESRGVGRSCGPIPPPSVVRCQPCHGREL